MILLMWSKLLARTETGRAYVYPIPVFASKVSTFYSNRVREITAATIALDLQTRLIYRYKVDLRKQAVGNYIHRRRRGHPFPATTSDDKTHFVFPQADAAVCGE